MRDPHGSGGWKASRAHTGRAKTRSARFDWFHPGIVATVSSFPFYFGISITSTEAEVLFGPRAEGKAGWVVVVLAEIGYADEMGRWGISWR